MQTFVADPALQTQLFAAAFFAVVIFWVGKKRGSGLFPAAHTTELKGAAMLMIVLAHIGYVLSSDSRFLFPLSVFAGVGVNLFLFLSGYGLTVSALQKPLSVVQFYRKRLPRLLVPLWVVLALVVTADYVFLQRSYGFAEIVQAVAGFFWRADVWQNINSPLWYFTAILFYYVLFPLLFLKKYPYASALALYGVAELVLRYFDPVHPDVEKLYALHTMAFPLGVVAAWVMMKWGNGIDDILPKKVLIRTVMVTLAAAVLGVVVMHTALNSGVGRDPSYEQTISLVTGAAFILLFIIKPLEFRLFTVFGLYSYEIYLLHWPLMSRYDVLFALLPAWLATLLYIPLLIALGWLLQKLVEKLLRMSP